MALTKYVSAQWVTPLPGSPPSIKAIGDDGLEYFIPSETTDVPPWPQYLADGGTIEPADSDVANQITDAPDDLTGGPTLGEVYGNP